MTDEELKEKYESFRSRFDWDGSKDLVKLKDKVESCKKEGVGIKWYKVIDKLFYYDLLYPLLDAAGFFKSFQENSDFCKNGLWKNLHFEEVGKFDDSLAYRYEQPYKTIWAALSGTFLVSYDCDFLNFFGVDRGSATIVTFPDYEQLAALQTSWHLLDRIALYIIDLVRALYYDDYSILDAKLFGLPFYDFIAAVIPDLEYNKAHPENPRGTKQHNLDQINVAHKVRIIKYRKYTLSNYAENPPRLVMPPREKFIDFTQSGYSSRGKNYYYDVTKERFQKVWEQGYDDPFSHLLVNSTVRKSLSGEALEYVKKADEKKDAAIMPQDSSLNSDRLSTKR